MTKPHDDAHAALKRMLANGPLTGVPKRPADEALLVQLTAARFEPGRDYSEAEVNEVLVAWLETFCEPYGIDHVTMRRMLVDARLLVRDKSGAAYRVDDSKIERLPFEPAAILAEVRAERAERKRSRAA